MPSTPGPHAFDDRGDALSIHEASTLLQVPAPTIRSWERRYGLPTGSRSSGGHRRYTRDDLVVLRRMRDEIAGGRRAADAATVASTAARVSPQVYIADIVAAAQRLDAQAVVNPLELARVTLGLPATIDDVLLPAMREIGSQWEVGRADVAHEHLATTAIQAWLRDQPRRTEVPTRYGPVVLGCGPQDFHTLGLDSIAALLSQRGVDCRNLGARTPVDSMIRAVRQTDAAAVLIVSHLAPGRTSALEVMRAVSQTDTAVYYAGNAFTSRQSRVGVPGLYLGENLAEAANLITAHLQAAPRRGSGS